MAYSPELDARIQKVVSRWPGTAHKKMFGGVCYLMNGNMVAGVIDDDLILRLGVEAATEALRTAGVKVFDITGRPMKGWVMVTQPLIAGDADLNTWLAKAKAFVDTLPSKTWSTK